jgi:CMP-N,N'-diacetyllegionaminic acid synthase
MPAVAMKVLGLIPARGDSKGIPRKNIKPLLGKSLVQRTIECARASAALDRVVLSTDSAELAALGRQHGVEVPFLRPASLAQDDSPMIDVAVHLLDVLRAQDYAADAVLVLQPTSPLRRPSHIQQAIRMLADDPAADAVCSVTPVPKGLCPHYLVKVEGTEMRFFMPDGHLYTRRQAVPQAWRRDGTIFLTRVRTLIQARNFYGDRCLALELAESDVLNVDEPADWEEAERRLRERETLQT